MKSIEQIVLLYLLIINLISLLTMGWDKWRAIHNGWRIPEKTLLGMGFIGGALGLLIGSKVYRHKTLKPLFRIGIPVLLLLNGIGIYGLFHML